MVAYFLRRARVARRRCPCSDSEQRGGKLAYTRGFGSPRPHAPWQNPITLSRDVRETLPRSRSRKRSAGARWALPIPLSILRLPIRSLRPFRRNPTTLRPPEPGGAVPVPNLRRFSTNRRKLAVLQRKGVRAWATAINSAGNRRNRSSRRNPRGPSVPLVNNPARPDGSWSEGNLQ